MAQPLKVMMHKYNLPDNRLPSWKQAGPSRDVETSGRAFIRPGQKAPSGFWSVPRTLEETVGVLGVLYPDPKHVLKNLLSRGVLLEYTPQTRVIFHVHGVWIDGFLYGKAHALPVTRQVWDKLCANAWIPIDILGSLCARGLVSVTRKDNE